MRLCGHQDTKHTLPRPAYTCTKSCSIKQSIVVSPHSIGAGLHHRPEDLNTGSARFCENCVQAEIQIWGKHTVDSSTLILTESARGMGAGSD